MRSFCGKVGEVGMKELIIKVDEEKMDIEGNAPVVDRPQELVRCKDCKHKEESVSPSWEAWCNRLHCGCDLDWFCADGERKE